MEPVQFHYPQEYSIETQELLAKPPVWMLRWGGSLIFTIIVAILILSWIVKYPEIIEAKATITTPVPPIAIIARQSGELHWLKTPEDPDIEKGDIIAMIKNPAVSADINRLKQWLTEYRNKQIEREQLPDNLILGEVQNSFANFEKILNEFNFFQTLNPLEKKMLLGKQKQQQFQQMLEQFQRQQSILQNEQRLINNNLQRFQKLKAKNLVSETKIDEIKIQLLDKQRQQEQIKSEIAKAKVSLTNQALDLTEYRLTNQQKLQNYKLKLSEALQALLTDISKWEKNYLLSSPIDGRLALSKYWSEHQFVKVDEEVVTIVPAENQAIIAKLKMPLANSGKVKPGQKILIKLEGYPYQEYGQLVSRVASISLVPREGLYTIDAQLPNPLVTSFNKTLNFDQEMQGKADIVTEDMRLIERVFYQILKIWVHKT